MKVDQWAKQLLTKSLKEEFVDSDGTIYRWSRIGEDRIRFTIINQPKTAIFKVDVNSGGVLDKISGDANVMDIPNDVYRMMVADITDIHGIDL